MSFFQAFIYLGAFCSSALSLAAATNVWIDTDPAIGAPWREVDDAYALVLAFRSPELRVVGISTTYGNAGLTRTTEVARDLVRRFGSTASLSDNDVHSGASSSRDVARTTAAGRALEVALRRQRLTYIALGPLTNLAAFLRQHPELARNIEQVIFVGGKTPGHVLAFGRGGRLRVHDANVFKDPAAVREVLRCRVPITLAPIETSWHLMLSREQFRTLQTDGTTGKFLASGSRFWFTFWTKIVGENGGPLFDTLPVLAAAKLGMTATGTRYAQVDASGDLTAAPHAIGAARAVRFCTRASPNATALILRRIAD